MNNLGEGQYFGDFKKTLENEFFKLSLTHYMQGDQVEMHDHDNSYLSILTEGRYEEDSKREVGCILPGEVLYRPSYYSHRNEFKDGAASCFNIEFKKEWKKSLDAKMDLPSRFIRYKVGTCPSLYKILLDFQLGNSLDMLSEHIFEWLFHVNEKPTGNPERPWVKSVIQILDHELNYFHSLSDLSERVCVHPVYLSRAFKESTGYTIGEYQVLTKLCSSLSRLIESEESISTISHSHGFFDDAHFIKSFKSRYGISPHQFRKTLNS